MLSVFISEKQNDWGEYLPCVLSAYRSSVHVSTSCTSNSLLYARETNLPIDLLPPRTRRDATKAENYPEYVQWVRKHLQKSLVRTQ